MLAEGNITCHRTYSRLLSRRARGPALLALPANERQSHLSRSRIHLGRGAGAPVGRLTFLAVQKTELFIPRARRVRRVFVSPPAGETNAAGNGGQRGHGPAAVQPSPPLKQFTATQLDLRRCAVGACGTDGRRRVRGRNRPEPFASARRVSQPNSSSRGKKKISSNNNNAKQSGQFFFFHGIHLKKKKTADE